MMPKTMGRDGFKQDKKPTPLPKLQLAVLLYLQLAEPITSTVILPFIVQVGGLLSLVPRARDNLDAARSLSRRLELLGEMSQK